MPSISPNYGPSRGTVFLRRTEEVSSEIRTMGDFKLKSGPLSPEARDLAEKELRETPENVKKAVEELRELLKKDDSMYFSDDEELLLVFLRPSHFYPESAYKLVSQKLNNYLMKQLFPNSYWNRIYPKKLVFQIFH